MAEAALTDTDKMIAAAEKFGDKLAQLATQYGPDVADVALLAAQVDAGSVIVSGAVWATGAAVPLFIAVRSALGLSKKIEIARERHDAWVSGSSREGYRTYDKAENAVILAVVSGVLGGVVGALLAVGALNRLFSVWAWVGVFEPKVWLAGKLLGWM